MDIQEHKNAVTPLLRWAGGKRWLVNSHADIFPTQFNSYIEPFAGSAAVFFKLLPEKAILADLNRDLIETYKAIQSDWQQVQILLEVYQNKHSKDYYYQTRAVEPQTLSSAELAARFIYLNRTCWNGLYRVNKSGKFNVPIGTSQNVLLQNDNLHAISQTLKNTMLFHQGFEKTIGMAKKGDFVFVDPPYTVKHNHNGFVSYNEKIFSWRDQELLCESVRLAVKRGVKVLVTNARHHSIMQLYKGLGEFIELERNNLISGKPMYRGRYEELIVRCY